MVATSQLIMQSSTFLEGLSWDTADSCNTVGLQLAEGLHYFVSTYQVNIVITVVVGGGRNNIGEIRVG